MLPKTQSIGLLVVLIGCGGTPPPTGGGRRDFSGAASMGTPVIGELRIESLSEDGSVLAEVTTESGEADGGFEVSAVTPDGWGRLCAQGGFGDDGGLQNPVRRVMIE